MKSIYQDQEFSDFWNSRVGDEGEDYKRYVLDPLMLEKVGSLKKKVVMEMGCGNGYMANLFLKQNPTTVWLMDISAANLEHAKEKTSDPRVKFLQHDITKKWPLKSKTVDLIYSNMVLNEVAVIDIPLQESHRVLKTQGQLIFSVLHPAYLLYFYAQQTAGVDSGKFINLGGYFSHNDSKYLMGTVSVTKPAQAVKVEKNFAVNQKQWTIEDYFNAVVRGGYNVKALYEPELNKELLQYNPGFTKYIDRPIGLVIHAVKV